MPATEPATGVRPEKSPDSLRSSPWLTWVVVAVFVLAALRLLPAFSSISWFSRISSDPIYKATLFWWYAILAGAFFTAFCCEPVLTGMVRRLRRIWRPVFTCVVLAGICLFMVVFIVHFGRWQFGGWDFSILVDTGWRQSLGQRPFVDFPATTPPLFNLGLKLAYEVFGANWDAGLYLASGFACATFLWLWWLMERLSMGAPAAIGVSFAIECAAMLSGCFWWFNNTTLVLAAIFFLACLAYASKPGSRLVCASYVVSLALLSLTKPNIAGLMIVVAIPLLLVITNHRARLGVLTAAAAGIAVGLLLSCHVSIAAMVANYLAVAVRRAGPGGRYGYGGLQPAAAHVALFLVGVLAIPLLGVVRKAVRQVRESDRRQFAMSCLCLLSLVAAVYGLLTNSDVQDVECTVLFAAGAVLTFGLRWNGPNLRRVFIALVCAWIAGDLYYGANRLRVYGIGQYFEWRDNRNVVDESYFKNVRVSATMAEMEGEVKQALSSNGGSVFFGPRLEFNYAAFGVESPRNLPVLWDPGAAFAVSAQDRYLRVWQDRRFETLIFLNAKAPPFSDFAAYTYYPQAFKDAILQGYEVDERYPLITVFHRRK